MEIERVEIGRSSGTVTKLASAPSSGKVIEGSKEEILAEARQCCALKNLANPIEKGLNVCAVASQIAEYSSEGCPVLLNSSQQFQCSMYLNVKVPINSRCL
jgi:hypothetical protein